MAGSGAVNVRKVLFSLLSTTILSTVPAAMPALAQVVDDPAGEEILQDDVILVETDNGVTVLDTILISGEKFERDYTKIYSSVGVATGEDIENYQLDDLRQSFYNMANVRWFDRDGGNVGFVIRGINSEGVTQPSNNAPVASVIIDGATQSVEGMRRGSRGTWDVKQIEVYRGPQSTLQGRNALAGAVVIETNDPSYEPEGAIQGTFGEDNRHDGAFMISGPISGNQAAFRVSGEFRSQDKDIIHTNPANAVIAEDHYRNIRGKILYEPEAMPGFSALFTVSHTYDKPGNTSVNAPFFNRTYMGDAFGGVEVREAVNNNYVADLKYEFNDMLTVQSVSSYVDTDMAITSPPGDILQRLDDREDDNFTQDLRFLIGNDDSRLSGVIGANYGNLNASQDSLITSLLAPVPVQDTVFTTATENFSAYADLRLKLNEHWSVLGGGRLMYERVRNTAVGNGLEVGTPASPPCTVVPIPFPPFALDVCPFITDFAAETEDTVALPSLGLVYEFDDYHSVAVTAKQGYRSGFTESIFVPDPSYIPGVNPPFVLFGTPNPVLPETMWAYEVAYRGKTYDNRGTLGVNAFYYDYTNQQIPIFVSAVSPYVRTINAGSSQSYGAEIEGRYAFDNGLSVFGALGFLQTEFTQLNDGQGNDLSGNEFPEAPELTAAFGFNYLHESGLFAGFDASYTSSYYSVGDLTNNPAVEVDSFWIANARVGYEMNGLKLTLFVDNVFNEQYVTSIGNAAATASIGDERKFGFEMTAKF